MHQVCQQVPVVRQVFAPIAAVEIGGKESYSTAPTNLVHDESRNVGGWLAHPRGFGREAWKCGNKRRQNRGSTVHVQRFQSATKGEEVRLLKTLECGMPFTVRRRFKTALRPVSPRSQFRRQP